MDKIKIDHLSWSQVNQYLTCPEEYYYKYIKHPELRREEVSLPLQLGSAYHGVLEGLYGGKAFSSLLNSYDLELEDNLRHKDVIRMRDALAEYQSRIFPFYKDRVQQVEEHVNDFYIDGIDVPIEMRIDMLTVDGVIIDHKTVGFPDVYASRNKQMLLYSYWFYKKYKEMPRGIELHKAYKNGDRLTHIDCAVPDFLDMMRVVELVKSVYASITAGIFPCYMGKYCSNSKFREESDSDLLVRVRG